MWLEAIEKFEKAFSEFAALKFFDSSLMTLSLKNKEFTLEKGFLT
jgi:hypothetical protein